MADELDLNKGDPTRAEASPSERRRMAREQARSSQSQPKSSTKSGASIRERGETELASRLSDTFDRIVKVLEARDDHELAGAIREDKDAMGRGLVSLTRNVKPLRSPLLVVLGFVEPALAFGNVGRILFTRFINRRQQKIAEFQAQQEAAAAENPAVYQ